MKLDDDHRVVAVAELVRGPSVLDIGAGQCLLEPFVHGTYTAVDISTAVLAAGERRAIATATHLPFETAKFDSVFCISVLQYVLDVENALVEFRRVVRPGGQVVVLVPNLAYLQHRVRQLRGRLAWSSSLDNWASGTLRYFTLPDLAPLLERLGFRVRDVRCSGRARGVRSRRPQLLGADLILDLETPT